ncbi:tRNA-specific adenosine deaminase [Rheinheimera sp. SA_1]|uniref:nucleoside deaminase n=1 Tax=Rheinheimera sp. SA_1 TaxID=1827365 RepID=UPI0007FE9527|nr:nucleoside deaminase [Rheinheimera sp. SA_1]OBP13457.1 tRNA-specific adenosine deaminase [Rheinheimera sp. SA_1]
MAKYSLFRQAPGQPVTITLPDWVEALVQWDQPYPDDNAKMALAIELSKQNVLRGTGGPFGTAIFDRTTNLLLGVGVNRVVPLSNSTLHGETVAIMQAEQALGHFSLASGSGRELFTSCEPCAMCLGAVLWSGVNRLVCAGVAADARAIGFDEGPVFAESYQYLQNAGIEVVRGFMQPEAKAVLDYYASSGGRIYNGSDTPA